MTTKALLPTFEETPVYTKGQSIEEFSEGWEKYAFYSGLSKRMMLLIMANAEDLVNKKVRTTRELAEATGISERTIGHFRVNDDFAKANGFILAKITACHVGDIILKIYKTLDNGSWNAGAFLLRLAGVHVDKLQTENVNVNIEAQRTQPQNFDEALDELLITLGAQGWSAAMIVERYNSLKMSGAF